jgi:hypothetical protein
VKGIIPTVLDVVTEVKLKVSWRWRKPELGCRAKGGGGDVKLFRNNKKGHL